MRSGVRDAVSNGCKAKRCQLCDLLSLAALYKTKLVTFNFSHQHLLLPFIVLCTFIVLCIVHNVNIHLFSRACPRHDDAKSTSNSGLAAV